MPVQAKYTAVMSVIKRRIREGDYLLSDIPGERRMAEETGVSYMTARKAMLELLDQKVLVRTTSGGFDVHPEYAKRAKPATVVLLYPAYPSTYLTQLRGLVSDFAQQQGIGLRPAQFVHWDETTVLEAVEQAKGTFVIPSGPEIPERLLEPFRANKVVILDGDFTRDGLPSIRLFSDDCIEGVMEHLYRLGHRRVDCLNTQNRNPEIDRRIDIWERWLPPPARRRAGCGTTRARCSPTRPCDRLPADVAAVRRAASPPPRRSSAPPAPRRSAPCALLGARRAGRQGPVDLLGQHRTAGGVLLPVDHGSEHAGDRRRARPVLRLVLPPAAAGRSAAAGAKRIGFVQRRIDRTPYVIAFSTGTNRNSDI